MKQKATVPGIFLKILSVIPFFNILALACMGIQVKRIIHTLFAVLYGVMLFTLDRSQNPSISMLLWLIPTGHFWCAYAWAKGEAHTRKSVPKENMAGATDTANHKSSVVTTGSPVSSVTGKPASAKPLAGNSVSEARPSKQVSDVLMRTVPSNYRNITVDGMVEKKEIIPQSTSQSYTYIGATHSNLSAHQKFMQDMHRYAAMAGKKVDFVPFMAYWPTYGSMNTEQKAWYFYWRAQVREQQYPDTDLSYIFVYIYELLSGIGWEKPADGQHLLLALWSAYRERYPKLDSYLTDWMFDFAQQHQLSYQVPAGCPLCMDQASVQADLLIDSYGATIPLKLPFDLIDALCDYALTKSKFYLDGHEQLMREAIPRVVALADAALRKKGKKGILAVYGPNRTKRQEHIMYSSALCPGANQRVEINVKAYTSSSRLREYMNELVRYGENVLRELYNCRGRLRGITLDDETAALVDSFLKKEYGQAKAVSDPLIARIAAQGIRYVDYRGKDGCLWLIGGHELNAFVQTLAKEGVTFTFKAGGGHAVSGDAWWTRDTLSASPQNPSPSKRRIALDFSSIDTLREQSDQVREALRVEEVQPLKPVLTDLKEVTAIYHTLSAQGKQLLHALGAAEWEMTVSADATSSIEEVNREARRILGCSILHNEHHLLITEDDYRDELSEVLSHQVEASVGSTATEDTPGEPLQAFLTALSAEQRQTLDILLYSQQISADLAQLAEQSLTLPQMLLDDLNEAALNSIGEIIIDTLGDTPCILDEYLEPLKSADKLEG